MRTGRPLLGGLLGMSLLLCLSGCGSAYPDRYAEPAKQPDTSEIGWLVEGEGFLRQIKIDGATAGCRGAFCPDHLKVRNLVVVSPGLHCIFVEAVDVLEFIRFQFPMNFEPGATYRAIYRDEPFVNSVRVLDSAGNVVFEGSRKTFGKKMARHVPLGLSVERSLFGRIQHETQALPGCSVIVEVD